MARIELRRRFGSTELSVHPICFGSNVFGWTVDREGGFALLDRYVELGGNFIDTADGYSKWVPGNQGGEAEELIGAWLAQRDHGDIVIATKVGGGSPALGLERGLAREQILRGCDASLRNLGVETIDLYYAHFDDPSVPLEETLGAFDELVRSGKVRYIAASNYSASRLRKALETSDRGGLARYQGLQPRLNLVDRDDFDDELAELALEYDLGVAVYSALASGFLTGKYSADAPVASPRAEGIAKRYLADPTAVERLRLAEEIARRDSAPVAQVALAWALRQSAVTCAIVSATSIKQLDALLGTLELGIDDADVAGLTAAVAV
jgi:aryl-alcohol dehydrogenase-like predicted oxidoreductase